MANRWKGNIIAAAATTSSGTDYTGKANGSWGLNSQLQQKQGGLWAKGVGAPSAPTIGSASGGISQASVSFTGSSDTGGGTITSYTATSTPGNITGTGSSSPIVVTGLTNGTSYTFKVKATNSLGYTSVESAASNSVTPINFSPPPMILYGTTGDSGYPGMGGYNWSSGYGTKVSTYAATTGYTVNGIAFNPVDNIVSIAGVYGVDGFRYNSINGIYYKYTSPSSSTTVYANTPNPICYNSSGTAIFVADLVSSQFAIWPFSSESFGTKYASPTLPSVGPSIQLDNTDSYLAISLGGTAPELAVYAWSSSGVGSKYADPATPSVSYIYQLTFTSNSDAIITAVNTSPYIQAYAWTSSGFGSKYSNPSTLPYSNGISVSFANNNVALGSNTSTDPYVVVYPWNVSSGFGTKYANPSTLSTATLAKSLSFNKAGSVLAVGTYTSPYLSTYTFSSGIGTKYANPSTLPESVVRTLALNF